MLRVRIVCWLMSQNSVQNCQKFTQATIKFRLRLKYICHNDQKKKFHTFHLFEICSLKWNRYNKKTPLLEKKSWWVTGMRRNFRSYCHLVISPIRMDEITYSNGRYQLLEWLGNDVHMVIFALYFPFKREIIIYLNSPSLNFAHWQQGRK